MPTNIERGRHELATYTQEEKDIMEVMSVYLTSINEKTFELVEII